MAILSVGIVGAMRVFPVGLRASRRAELSSRAVILAQRALECLKLKPWDQLVEGEDPGLCKELPASEATNRDRVFTVTSHISQPAIEHVVDPTRLKAIEITVGWTQDGRPRALTFVTYLREASAREGGT